jgi:hypothetical protein
MPGTGTGQGRTLGHALLAIQYVNLTRLAPLVMPRRADCPARGLPDQALAWPA